MQHLEVRGVVDKPRGVDVQQPRRVRPDHRRPGERDRGRRDHARRRHRDGRAGKHARRARLDQLRPCAGQRRSREAGGVDREHRRAVVEVQVRLADVRVEKQQRLDEAGRLLAEVRIGRRVGVGDGESRARRRPEGCEVVGADDGRPRRLHPKSGHRPARAARLVDLVPDLDGAEHRRARRRSEATRRPKVVEVRRPLGPAGGAEDGRGAELQAEQLRAGPAVDDQRAGVGASGLRPAEQVARLQAHRHQARRLEHRRGQAVGGHRHNAVRREEKAGVPVGPRGLGGVEVLRKGRDGRPRGAARQEVPDCRADDGLPQDVQAMVARTVVEIRVVLGERRAPAGDHHGLVGQRPWGHEIRTRDPEGPQPAVVVLDQAAGPEAVGPNPSAVPRSAARPNPQGHPPRRRVVGRRCWRSRDVERRRVVHGHARRGRVRRGEDLERLHRGVVDPARLLDGVRQVERHVGEINACVLVRQSAGRHDEQRHRRARERRPGDERLPRRPVSERPVPGGRVVERDDPVAAPEGAGLNLDLGRRAHDDVEPVGASRHPRIRDDDREAVGRALGDALVARQVEQDGIRGRVGDRDVEGRCGCRLPDAHVAVGPVHHEGPRGGAVHPEAERPSEPDPRAVDDEPSPVDVRERQRLVGGGRASEVGSAEGDGPADAAVDLLPGTGVTARGAAPPDD